jgi:hypothetical protein
MSSARSLTDLLYRRNRGDSRSGPTRAEEQLSAQAKDPAPRTQPIPLTPGEPVDLRMPEVQEQDFPFEAGEPLPNRGPRTSQWSSIPLSAAVVEPNEPLGTTEPPDPTEPLDIDHLAAIVDANAPVTGDTPSTRPNPAARRGAPVPSPASPPRQAPAWPEPPRPTVQQDLRPPAPHLIQLSPVPEPAPTPPRKDYTVSNIETILKEAMQIDGAIGVALVDYTSGMTLGQAGGNTLNLDVAAAGNTEVVRAKLRTMEALGMRDGIEDILITLSSQYHLIRLINDQSGLGLFLYLALNKNQANLALARHKLANLERQIEV